MKIFITGVTGQDGSLTAKLLSELGHDVYGGYRRGIGKLWRLEHLNLLSKIKLVDYEIGNGEDLAFYLAESRFDQIYHFAGFSRTSDSFTHPKSIVNTNITGVLELLEAARLGKLTAKIFICGSSEIFAQTEEGCTLNETSQLGPANPYGVSLASAKFMSNIYRNVHGLNIFYGILFNHESFLRDSIFISKKLAMGFDELSKGEKEILEIGNLNTVRDWGLAHEFVAAMVDLLQDGIPGDYIFATGKLHTLTDLVFAFANLYGFNLDLISKNGQYEFVDVNTGQALIRSNSRYLRPVDTRGQAGDPTKLFTSIGRTFSTDLNALAKIVAGKGNTTNPFQVE